MRNLETRGIEPYRDGGSSPRSGGSPFRQGLPAAVDAVSHGSSREDGCGSQWGSDGSKHSMSMIPRLTDHHRLRPIMSAETPHQQPHSHTRQNLRRDRVSIPERSPYYVTRRSSPDGTLIFTIVRLAAHRASRSAR